VVHGSNDERYPRAREGLEQLMSTAGRNRAFLLYTANSGRQSTGHYSRMGDRHTLDSIRHHDCLGRLVDAALNAEGPEKHFLRTCRERLQAARLEAEGRLGYTPAELRRSWASGGQGGIDDVKLFDVPPDSEEFDLVSTVFKAQPVEKATYQLKPQHVWDATSVARVQRVENCHQQAGSARPDQTWRRSRGRGVLPPAARRGGGQTEEVLQQQRGWLIVPRCIGVRARVVKPCPASFFRLRAGTVGRWC